jgi:anti-sigma factor RsiW
MWGTAEKPCPSERTLAAHVDGQLDASRAEAVESHLDECAACARVVRRVEGLSNLLRTWETGTRVEPPSRLSAAVLRTVAPEAEALRRESMRASARAFAFAAAVVVAIGAGVAAALMTAAGSPGESVTLAARSDVAAPTLAPSGVGPAALDFGAASLAAVTRARFEVSPEVAAAAPRAGALPSVPDAEATAAFVRYAPFLETQARVEEDVYVVYDRALPRYAAGPYARARRIEAWYEERARRASEPATFDPSSRGLSVLDVLPLPSAAELPAFLAKLPTFVEPASRRGGGFVVRPLPGRAASAGEVADGGEVSDLAGAVAAQRIVIEPDASAEATSLTLDVAPTTVPVLIPAGELVAGGAGDRVVTEGLWLPASSVARTVVLACLPVSRIGGAVGRAPAATGLVAGPELRGLLAYRAERDGVLALVDGQVGDAALDRGEDGRTSLLALYDVASPEVAVAKALATEFASRFA